MLVLGQTLAERFDQCLDRLVAPFQILVGGQLVGFEPFAYQSQEVFAVLAERFRSELGEVGLMVLLVGFQSPFSPGSLPLCWDCEEEVGDDCTYQGGDHKGKDHCLLGSFLRSGVILLRGRFKRRCWGLGLKVAGQSIINTNRVPLHP